MVITLSNCERVADKETREKAWGLFRAGKVKKITHVDINEHIGSLYEGEIKIGNKTNILCFAITKNNTIVLGKCFCDLAEGVLCPHYLAVLLHLKYKKQVEMSKNIYCPVRILFSGSESDVESVSKTVDKVFDRYLRKNKINEWYMPFAIEGIIFACMTAEEENKSFIERFKFYCMILKKLDKLFTLAIKPYNVVLIEHAKGVLQLINKSLKENLPKESLLVVKPCYEEMYNTSSILKNWVIKYNCLECLLLFCDTPSLRINFADKVKRKINAQKDEKKKSDLKVLYLLLLRGHNAKLSTDYLLNNLNDPAFRKIAIDLSMSVSQEQEAIRLAKEGLKKEGKDIESKKYWWKILFKIYTRLADLMNMKGYAKKLILEGDFDYFILYKKYFNTDEWIKERDNILESVIKKGKEEFYLQLVLEENLQSNLYEYCKKRPNKILTLYPYFERYYYDNLVEILKDYRNNIIEKGDIQMVNLVIKKLSLLV